MKKTTDVVNEPSDFEVRMSIFSLLWDIFGWGAPPEIMRMHTDAYIDPWQACAADEDSNWMSIGWWLALSLAIAGLVIVIDMSTGLAFRRLDNWVACR